jgi:outer membrane protein assembly factor BamB
MLFALKEGKLVWKYATDDKILGGANWVRSPDGTATWIVVGSYDFRLHCVDAATGAPVWTYETENFINGAPAIDAGRAVFGGCDAVIHVVSLADGKRVIGIDSGSYIAGSAAVVEGRAYVGNYEGHFMCVDVTGEDAPGEAAPAGTPEAAGGTPPPEPSGDVTSRGGPPPSPRILWRYEAEDGFFSSPAVGETSVVVGCRDRKLHCINRADGAKQWTFPTRGEVDSSPVICGDKVVFGSADGWLYVVRLADGTKVWSYEIGEAVTASPAVAGGVVVIGSEDGWVYAFGPGGAAGE